MNDGLGPVLRAADRGGGVLFRRDFGPCFDALAAVRSPEAATTSIHCRECDEGHTTDIFEDVNGLYAYCPDTGLVQIEAADVERWKVEPVKLARLLAKRLKLGGEVENIRPSRVWRLGVLKRNRKSWPVLFAVGLDGPDGAEVFAEVDDFRVANAVVVVPIDLPAAWPGATPLVVRLSEVLSFDGTELQWDFGHVAAILGIDADDLDEAEPAFSVPAGTVWADLRITVGTGSLTLTAGPLVRTFTATEAGLENVRKKAVQNTLWLTLVAFARGGGFVPADGDGTPFKQDVYSLRKALAALTGIAGDPVPFEKKSRGYRTAFRVRLDDTVPTVPPGLTEWEELGFVERPGGRFDVLSRGEIHETVGRTELGWGPETLTVFVEILRGEGRLQRPAADPAVLALADHLRQRFGLAGDPLRFRAGDRPEWSAMFEVESAVRGGH